MTDSKEINPKEFGLSNRVKLIEIEPDKLGIVKKRKSRIIMKDGQQILEIAEKIGIVKPESEIVLIVSGPVCSKTKSLLKENNISIISEIEH
jgi:hypothetical protein